MIDEQVQRVQSSDVLPDEKASQGSQRRRDKLGRYVGDIFKSPRSKRTLSELAAASNGQEHAEQGQLPADERYNLLMRRVAQMLVLAGAFCFGAVFIMGAIGTIATQLWVVELAREHFASTVGLPFAALAALCLVVILEINAGPIHIRGFGFEFRGASGPIIMWVFCFLAIVAAIKLTWLLR
jgi:hypothetical protein